MEMKKIFEKSFRDSASPEAYYIYGDPFTVFVIAKHCGDDSFSLYALDVVHRVSILISFDDSFCKLVDIINTLTHYSFGYHSYYESYYERPIEE